MQILSPVGAMSVELWPFTLKEKSIIYYIEKFFLENNGSEYSNEYVSEYSSKYVSEYTSEYISECTNECSSDYVKKYITSDYISE